MLASVLDSAPRALIGVSLLALTFGTGPLAAVDGVVEINQVKALAGEATPGDAPGFPVEINEPGSYRLTSNLVVDDVEVDAIDVVAANVTLDLNGFSILGPISCTVSEGSLSCTPDSSTTSTGDGIKVRGNNFAVSNGVIRGMGRTGIVNFANPRPFPIHIENLRLLENGLSGIGFSVTPEVTVVDCMVARNKEDGMLLADAARVEGTTVTQNGRYGLFLFGSSGLVRDNVIDGNFVDGVRFAGGSDRAMFLANQISNNLGVGIGGGTYSYGNNVFEGNGTTVTGTGVELGVNVCNGSTTCP